MTSQNPVNPNYEKQVLLIQKQLLEGQIEIQNLEYENEIADLNKIIQNLQKQRQQLLEQVRLNDQGAETQFGSPSQSYQTDDVSDVYSYTSPSYNMQSSTHSVFNSTDNVNNSYVIHTPQQNRYNNH